MSISDFMKEAAELGFTKTGSGAPGTDGATWITGTAAPANATGKDGDLFLNTTTLDVSKRAAGSWSVIASLKATGGGAGNTILNGTATPPAGSTGNDGDFYLNTSTYLIYGPKASGAWPAGVALRANTILTTSGVPASGTGNNGDFAYDPTAKTMYGPKASGAWPAGVSFAGTNGTNGNSLRTTTGAPSNAVGVDGDYAYDPVTFTMYGPKTGGAWSAGTVIAGSGGGAAGNTILTTTGAPSNATGNNGDYAYDPTAKTMYGPKSAGAWTAGTLLAGTNGTNGSTWISTSGAPSNGLGNNGDYAIDTAAKIIYGPKATGAWPGGVSLAGTNGTNGNTLLNGTATPPGAGVGNNGDFYLNTSTSVIYGPKSAGAWPGGTSLIGATGNSVLNGTATPPGAGVGNNGDFYLNTSTYLIYGPKAAGAWPAGVSIKGTNGAGWFTGSGAPASGFANPGDYYIDTASTNLTYYNKANTTTWNVVGTLRGTAGANGNTVLTTSGQPASGTGNNGDFAYDPITTIMYGPKTAGAWAAGVSLTPIVSKLTFIQSAVGWSASTATLNTAQILTSCTVSAGTMLANSFLEFFTEWTIGGTTAGKSLQIVDRATGLVIMNISGAFASSNWYGGYHIIVNRNSLTSQYIRNATWSMPWATNSGTPIVGTLDFSVDRIFDFTGTLPTTGDSIKLEHYQARIWTP